MTGFTIKAKHGNMRDVIFTFPESLRYKVFAQQWLDLFVMFTMELSAAPHSVQVLTWVLACAYFNLFIFFIPSCFRRFSLIRALTLLCMGLDCRYWASIFGLWSNILDSFCIFHYTRKTPILISEQTKIRKIRKCKILGINFHNTLNLARKNQVSLAK